MSDQFVPEDWLVSGFNALQDYITTKINDYIKNNVNVSAGLQAYEIVMDFPDSADIPRPSEFTKTIIHFAIDDIDNTELGFGPGFVAADVIAHAVDPAPPAQRSPAGTIAEHEARCHVINFDVGVWSSDKSGGSTSRLRAYQMLDSILGGETAKEKCRDFTGGVEIRHFTNGRFIIERPNDIRTYRMVGGELVVRVYSRKVTDPVEFADVEPSVTPDVEIGSATIVDN